MTLTHAASTTTVIGLLAILSGCATVRNERVVIGPENAPTTVKPEALWGSPPLEQATGPSATALSRANWGEVTIVSVNDGVEHQDPLTRRWPVIDTATARSRGEFPTAESCVETGGSPGAQVLEGFAWPMAIGSDIVMAIPRMFHQANQSPIERYGREAPVAPAAAPAE